MRRRAVVIGAGVSGLSCALVLARKGWRVTVVSQHDPWDSNTCSQGAGGLWMPFHVEPPHKTNAWAEQTLSIFLEELQHNSSKTSANAVTQTPKQRRGECIEVLPVVVIKPRHTPPEELPEWTRIPSIRFQQLPRDELSTAVRVPKPLPDHFWGGWLFHAPVIHAERYLEALVSELRDELHVQLVFNIKKLSSLKDALAFVKDDREDDDEQAQVVAVFNCCGLGGGEIMKGEHRGGTDGDVIAGRGVTIHVERPSDVCAVVTCDCAPFSDERMMYVIPRGNALVTVGGTFVERDWNTNVDQSEVDRIRSDAALFFPSLKDARVVKTWVGLRPVRHAGVCLEVERMRFAEHERDENAPKSKRLRIYQVQNYGHGGSGWTLMYGCAEEAVRLLEESIERDSSG